MIPLLLENLAKLQAFDGILNRGAEVRRIADAFVGSVLLEPDAKRRAAALPKLEQRVVDYFGRTVQPAARALGDHNARAVLRKLEASGVKPDLADPELRRRVLLDGTQRPQTRVAIVRHLVNDQANTLENRLAAYWLEPGQSATAKVQRLAELHQQQAAAEKRYESQLHDYYAKHRDSRPAKPKTEFLARFQGEATQAVREQARRAGTDAETGAFEKAGYQQLSWVTVNASEACPDCRERQGRTGNAAFWDQEGRPGAGRTVCGRACMCLLVPAPTLRVAPDLAARGLDTAQASQITHPR